MIINIPNVGEVNFPDSMSETDINSAAKRLYDQSNPNMTKKVWQGNELVTQGVPSQTTALLPDNVSPVMDSENPFAYLSESQKTEQGPIGQAIGQGVQRGVQVGAGVAKGAIINPASAIMQLVGGETGRKFAEETQKSYEQQRKAAGAEGFDWAELAGAVASPVNKLIPGGPTTGIAGKVVGRGVTAGATGAALNPVTGENLDFTDVALGKIQQMGLGALVGRLGTNIAEGLVPVFRPGVQDLIKQGVPVSPGQAYEGMPGWLFRQMESMGLGPSTIKVNKSFNNVVANDVLSSIEKEVPSTVKPGQHAVAYVQKQISDFYDTALEALGKNKFDLEYKTGVNKSIQNVLNDIANPAEKDLVEKRLVNSLNTNIGNRVKNGEVSGRDIKDIQVWLKDEISKLDGKTGVIKESLKTGYEDILANLNMFVTRVDKNGNISKADQAWAKLYDFAQASKSAAKEGGVFSPEQLAQASSTQAQTLLSAGGGKGPLNPLAQQGIDVLGEQKPMSLLKGLMIGSKAATGVATAAIIPQVAIPILTASGMSYGAAKLLMKDPSKARIAIQKALQENPGLLGSAAANIYNQNQ